MLQEQMLANCITVTQSREKGREMFDRILALHREAGITLDQAWSRELWKL
jgi:hypothetical protein